MILRGRVQNGVVVFAEQVQLPEGTEVQIEPLPAPAGRTLAEQFADIIGSAPDLPPDMAERHDDYIHGKVQP